MLKAAKHPVILIGRVSRSVDGWNERIALAEALNAKVITDLKIGCGFPTDHPLHAGAPASNAMVPEAIEALQSGGRDPGARLGRPRRRPARRAWAGAAPRPR